LSFEVQELPDVIRIIVLLTLSKGTKMQKSQLMNRIDRVCTGYVCVENHDLDEAMKEMVAEGLIVDNEGTLQLTDEGARLGKEWQSLLLKKEPIIEVVAGLLDGSITGLVVVISELVAGLAPAIAAFAAFLTLAAVAITNFSSFLLGGITADLADMMTLQTLMNYSLSDIPDKTKRDKSLLLTKHLFTLLHKEISRSNIYAAMICGTTTFLAGSMPIIAYLALPRPFNIFSSLMIVATVVGVFLVRYRSKKTRVHWKVTLFETVAIVAIAVIASLILGGVA